MQTDEDLVSAYLAGEEKALDLLIQRYLKPIYNFIYRYIGNQGDAEDIVQDTFVNVWKSIRKFDRTRKFKTWIFTIARNASLNWIKKKKPQLFSQFDNEEGDNVIEESTADPSPLPDELFARADLSKKLSEILEKLSPEYRLVILLHYTNHFTFQEISELLKVPLNTVKSRHRRALISLKKIVLS